MNDESQFLNICSKWKKIKLRYANFGGWFIDRFQKREKRPTKKLIEAAGARISGVFTILTRHEFRIIDSAISSIILCKVKILNEKHRT